MTINVENTFYGLSCFPENDRNSAGLSLKHFTGSFNEPAQVRSGFGIYREHPSPFSWSQEPGTWTVQTLSPKIHPCHSNITHCGYVECDGHAFAALPLNRVRCAHVITLKARRMSWFCQVMFPHGSRFLAASGEKTAVQWSGWEISGWHVFAERNVSTLGSGRWLRICCLQAERRSLWCSSFCTIVAVEFQQPPFWNHLMALWFWLVAVCLNFEEMFTNHLIENIEMINYS